MRVKLASVFAVAAMTALPSAAAGQVGSAGGGETHYVFFDFGRPVLTRDAEAILDEVAVQARGRPAAVLNVVGFSDASGPLRANAAVSRRRAEVVRAYLETRGVSRPNIRVSSHGEQRLLVPTADGVREAQNRRVEIRLVDRSPQ